MTTTVDRRGITSSQSFVAKIEELEDSRPEALLKLQLRFSALQIQRMIHSVSP